MARKKEFGDSWWGAQWVGVLQSFGWSNRLQRGRSYARRGYVLEIKTSSGRVEALVKGSRPRPYRVRILVKALTDAAWGQVVQALAARADFTARLLAGEMPADIEEAFASAHCSLFPASSRDLETRCSCPDWANPCKHIAAVYYLMAQEFDRDPFILFLLRGRSREALLLALREQWAVPAAPTDPTDPAKRTVAAINGGILTAGELETFWGDGREREIPVRMSIPDVPEAILKQLGHPPFAREEAVEYLVTLEEYYRLISERARRL